LIKESPGVYQVGIPTYILHNYEINQNYLILIFFFISQSFIFI